MNVIERIMDEHAAGRIERLLAMPPARRKRMLGERLPHALRMARGGDPVAVSFLRNVLAWELTHWRAEDVIALVIFLESPPGDSKEQPPPRWRRWLAGLRGWLRPWRPRGDPLAEVCPDCNCFECCCDEVAF